MAICLVDKFNGNCHSQITEIQNKLHENNFF